MPSGINLLPSKERKDSKDHSGPVIIEMTKPEKAERPVKRQGGVLQFFKNVFQRPTPAAHPPAHPPLASMHKDREGFHMPQVKSDDSRPHVTFMPTAEDARMAARTSETSDRPSQNMSGVQTRTYPVSMPPPPVSTRSYQEVPAKKEVRMTDMRQRGAGTPAAPGGPGFFKRFALWFGRLFQPRLKSNRISSAMPPPPPPAPPPPRTAFPRVETQEAGRIPPPPPPVSRPVSAPPPPRPVMVAPVPIDKRQVPPVPPPPIPPVQKTVPPAPRGPGFFARLLMRLKRLFRKSKTEAPPAPMPAMPAVPPPPMSANQGLEREALTVEEKKPAPKQKKKTGKHPIVSQDQPFTDAPEVQPGQLRDVNLVPDDLLGESQPARKVRPVAIAGVCAILVVILAYVGLYWYRNIVIGETKEIDEQIQQVRTSIKGFEDFRVEAEDLRRRVDDVAFLLDHHIHWNTFFDLLETHTLADVYYTDMTVGSGGVVALNAVARDTITVARQYALFQNSEDFIQDVSISAVAPYLDPKTSLPAGQIFSVSLTVQPSLFIESSE
ncbi:MAG: hypothetical protein UY34_C0004G0024 [Parcubacteria group bacterium GW2011_GWA2_48_9]|nr:MAG: hypothetical protein UY34_C0004G0024 [Parcubacteria group bacterium GW2011_GWA2_48_9]